jgi:hypothetical protein
VVGGRGSRLCRNSKMQKIGSSFKVSSSDKCPENTGVHYYLLSIHLPWHTSTAFIPCYLNASLPETPLQPDLCILNTLSVMIK